ncbi:MAG: hypothetical protein Q8N31_19640 [Reyranella sp.]|nr:hypothetical protein [Reyranella sp.]MDP3162232.1 hypothetical protein [Reyranella sp.]
MSHVPPTGAPNRPKPAVSVEQPLAIDRVQPAEAWAQTGGIASWLIAQGFGPQSAPVAILSGDSPERALFFFGALRAGVLVASVDFASLDHALDTIEPALVFAQDSRTYGAALDRAQARGARIVTADGKRGLALAALAACSIDAAVAERRLHITADTPAEIQFTGPSGAPGRRPRTHGDLAEFAAPPAILAGGNG